jgi:hypothetical protein
MARGWESKSVEAQQQEAASPSNGGGRAPLTPAQAEVRRKRDALVLSRKNVERQLSLATNPRHRQMLEAALADLDGKIAQMG